jgi:short-subunit dehydrogenase
VTSTLDRSTPASAPWRRALVTGASAGIGDAIARRLGNAGVDLVLVARRADRLESLAAELRSATTRVDVLPADLGDRAGLDQVAARLASDAAPVDPLVNNAGFGAHGLFWERPVERAQAQIDVNVSALVHLTHAALGRMVRDARGAVMNISSVAGNQPGPRSAIYAATKAFVTNFTEGLAVELKGTGVTVTAVLPGLTHSEFHDVSGVGERPRSTPEFLWMTADAVAAEAIDATAKGRVVHVTGLGNRVLSGLSGVAPRGLRRRATGVVLRRR